MRKDLTEVESIALVRHAFDLGVNFVDTARNYGTEELVGKAAKEAGRDRIVISTKSGLREGGELISRDMLRRNIADSLARLQTDYIDVFHLHAVKPSDYRHAYDILLPELREQKISGAIRAIGITESSPADPEQLMLRQALQDDAWDVIMLAFNLMHQRARKDIFPVTQARSVGTLLMFVVRNVFSQPELLKQTVRRLVSEGALPEWMAERDGPLDFLIHDGGATSVVDAAYRYARHEPGIDVVLFGTGRLEHLDANVRSLLSPPLPEDDLAKISALFGGLVGIGLDAPHVK